MKCKNYKCKKEIPDGTKKCPHCGWEVRSGSQFGNNGRTTLTLVVSTPEKENNGSFKVCSYAIARQADGDLVPDGHKVIFHSDDLDEAVETTSDGGRANHTFNFSAQQTGQSVVITAHTQIGNKRFEATKNIALKTKGIEPMKILPSANLIALGGGEIRLQTKFELPVNLHWHIINLGRDTGTIHAATGVYKAPDVIPTKKTIMVEAIDQNRPNNKAEVEITLLPVEMKVGSQEKIHAREENIQLAIESHNDLYGLNNFTCKIISKPEVGRIASDGIYLPPKRVNRVESIKVEATSNLDLTKKVMLEFEVGFPLCPKCKAKETDADGKCVDCGQVLSSLVKPQKCPRCKSLRWNGITCPTCNYPKPWKVK